jgi:hypothetical protein
MTGAGSARAAPPSSPQRVAETARQRPRRGASDARAQPSPRRAATIAFAALVLATFAGLLLAQRIKHTPTSVQGFRLSPSSFAPEAASHPASARGVAAHPAATEELSFRTAKADEVTVAIVGSSGETVATLVADLPWPRYLRLCLTWNGRRGVGRLPAGPRAIHEGAGICPAEPVLTLPTGRLAPGGDYRVRVSLRGQHHSVLSPSSFALVRGTASSS